MPKPYRLSSRISIIAAVLLCSVHFVNAQPSPLPAFSTIDSVVLATMKANKIPGISVGIVKDGRIFYMQGYGTRTRGKEEPVDSLSNFLTCSISKLFTTTAIMQLVEAGKIDISKKLTDYLPEFRMKDPRYQEITIEQILTHTSGLPNIGNRHFISPENDSLALSLFAQKLSSKKLSFPPGVQLSAKTYSNTGFDILGLVVERVSGRNFSAYMNEHILQPVGMLHSSFFIDSIPAERRSNPHLKSWLTHRVHVSGYYPDIPQDKPCGNLNSNSYDLCRWMLHNLAVYHGKNEPRSVLKQNTLLDMWTTHEYIPPHETSIGWGWWVVHSKKYGKYVFHVGNDPGYSAQLIISPANDFGIVILCNAEYPKEIIWNQLAFQVMDLFSSGWTIQDDILK